MELGCAEVDFSEIRSTDLAGMELGYASRRFHAPTSAISSSGISKLAVTLWTSS
jgi:hypothetical protein